MTSDAAGAAAELAAAVKTNKYNQPLATHLFLPLDFETMGSNGLDFINDFRLILITGDKKETCYVSFPTPGCYHSTHQ